MRMINMNTYIKESRETFQVRNENIEVISMFRFDGETNQIVFDEELDNQAINKAFDIYRKKYNILSKEEIKQIREMYKLSQRAFAKLLGWSPATIARYERGSVPTKVNNSLLISLRDNQDLANSLFIQNKENLGQEEQEKLANRLKELEGKNESNDLVELIESRFDDQGITIMSGYQKFNFEKVKQMIIYFSSQIDYLSKTKLNKLLFYSDFSSFKNSTVSMSGMIYLHDHYGPVPKHSSLIYSALEENGVIEWIPFSSNTGEMVRPNETFDSSNFSIQELELLKDVVGQFKNDKANDISTKSHEETAYKKTTMKEDISYSFAMDLKYL